jgi:amidohydrolase
MDKRRDYNILDTIDKAVKSITDDVIALRRDFHANPELGFQEFRTAGIVEKYLQDLNIVTKRIAKTGVVGLIEGSKPGPVLMLRADMDALPVTEENDIPYKSKNPGVMHACGHDGHTAALLGAAKILNDLRSELEGTIKLVFQPNEEIAGACKMIEEGVLENPKVDSVMGAHIWTPVPIGKIGISSGAVMAGLENFTITVNGFGGHTGYPESAVDPIIAATDIVQTAQRIQTREISSNKPTIIMFGYISGGTQGNIIPDSVTLKGSIRILYDDCGEERPMERLKKLAEQVSAVHGCTCEVESYTENIPLINNPKLTELARNTAERVIKNQEDLIDFISMGSEDFSEFSKLVPGVFVAIGTGNKEKESHYPHHNPRFNIDEDSLPMAVEMYVRYTLDYFELNKKERAK